MKFKYNKPKYGTQRVVKKFTLLPRYVEGNIIWLEYVYVRQEYMWNIFFIHIWAIALWDDEPYRIIKKGEKLK